MAQEPVKKKIPKDMEEFIITRNNKSIIIKFIMTKIPSELQRGQYEIIWDTLFKFPNEYLKKINELDDVKIKNFNIEKYEEKGESLLKCKEYGYSYSFVDCLIKNHVVLRNNSKIPLFECVMFDLLEIITTKSLPNVKLDDFLVSARKGEASLFGTLFYFIDLTSPSSDYFKSVSSVKDISIENVFEIMMQINELVGESNNYNEFKQFITRIKQMKLIEEIKEDEFYKLCKERKYGKCFDKDSIWICEDLHKEATLTYSQLEDAIPIGKGGFGAVYKGEYKEKEIAIKILHYTVSESFYKKECLRSIPINREPNIVNVIGTIGESNEKLGIVMDYCPNNLKSEIEENIKENINKEKSYIEIKPENTLSYIIDLSTGILKLIHIGIVHRDYKTENVIITKENRALICDFGTSISITKLVTINTYVMTPGNVPPSFELAQDKFTNDIYSFGVLLSNFLLKKTTSEYSSQLNNKFPNLEDKEKYKRISEELRKIILKEINEKSFDCDLKVYIKNFIVFIEKLLKEDENERANCFDLEEFRELTIKTLKEKYNKEYVMEGGKKPFVGWKEIVNECINWYETNFGKRQENHPFYYEEIKEKIEKNTIDKSTVIQLLSMLKSLAFHCSQSNDNKGLKEMYYFIQTILSYHLISSTEEKKYMNLLSIMCKKQMDN